MDENKAMTKREIVRQISHATNLKNEVVEDVLNGFIDLFILETVATGKFRLDKCFTVDTSVRSARRQFNVHTGEYEEFPETEVLNIKLARHINHKFRWKNRMINNEKFGMSVDDFKNRDKNEEMKD